MAKTNEAAGGSSRLSGDTLAGLLPVLQKIQDEKGFICDEDMQDIAQQLGIHPVEVYSVVTFYSFLTVKKLGNHVIRVSTCPACMNAGSEEVIKEFEKVLHIEEGHTTPDGEFTLQKTSCIGMCDFAPAVLVDGGLVGNVTTDKVAPLLDSIKQKKNPLPNTYAIGSKKYKGDVIFSDIAPYAGIKKALEIGRVAVLDEVRDSGIKGRGGAGFPTGVKWNLAAAAQGEKKFVVCNADEGEPGTFKDRVLLTEYASLMFEGMAIAGFAIGAENGIVYLRGEYVSFLPALHAALEKMKNDNALGKNIMGKDFNFEIDIRLGSGAYVCGEETALIESLEGKRGEPRNRPPFPVNVGYMGFPTIVNNVETLIAAVHIIAKDVAWFKKIGTEKSSGTKVISVSGDCANPGVYEIPFGTKISEILSMTGAKDTLAVQVGGASGICVFEKDFNRVIGYEDLSTGGSIMIFDKSRDMLHVAENFLDFFEEESCGQCTPCREGIPVLIEMLEKIKEDDLNEVERGKLNSLSETMQFASKCGLGQSVPNALLTILENIKN